jgi:hypothetical protein
MENIIHFYTLYTLATLAYSLFKSVKKKRFKDDLLIARGGGGKGGGSSSPTPPAAPDPSQTASAQTGSNVQTAQANALLENPTVQSPYGTISYDTNQQGIDTSATNLNVSRPTQTITLSPQEQTLFNASMGIGGTLAGAGQQTANYLAQNPIFNPTYTAVPTSINLSGVDQVPNQNTYLAENNQVKNAVYQQGLSLIQPQLDQQKQQLQDQLIASGNPIDSPEYQHQMSIFNTQYNQALSNLADQATVQGYNTQSQLYNNELAGINAQYQQAYAPYTAAQTVANNAIGTQSSIYNQNLNMLSALLRGSPAITSPTSTGYNPSSITPTNVGQITNEGYQNQLAAYNIGNANNNAYNSGLFSIGAQAAAPLINGMFSL